jgi:CHAD domain-containing protein
MNGRSSLETLQVPPLSLPNTPEASRTLGEHAYILIRKQVRVILKHKAGVLKHTDPECLHQMRVATRRLRTALNLFGSVIQLPKPLQEKALKRFARKLGKLRDVDVQLAALHESYHPRLLKDDKTLFAIVEALGDSCSKAFRKVQSILTSEVFDQWEIQWQKWLESPVLTSCQDWPVISVLPDLLMPGLSRLLFHSAWHVSMEQLATGGEQFHDLRKCCKEVRYQSEFFGDYYGSEFHQWIGLLKALQECLGQVQDAEVLLQLLKPHLKDKNDVPELHGLVVSDRESALQEWQNVRQDFLNPEFRYALYNQLLKPTALGISYRIIGSKAPPF